jgi:uncharacterized protein (TIGR00725 family)
LCIAVCGPNQADPSLLSLAHAVGNGLALAGAVIMCGGLGGVMEAACRGARDANGITIGILPSADAHTANPFVTIRIATGMGEARNTVLINSADTVIALGGGWGTLSEIALARRSGRAVIGLQSWRPSGDHALVDPVATPEEAVERAIAAARERRGKAGSAGYQMVISEWPL